MAVQGGRARETPLLEVKKTSPATVQRQVLIYRYLPRETERSIVASLLLGMLQASVLVRQPCDGRRKSSSGRRAVEGEACRARSCARALSLSQPCMRSLTPRCDVNIAASLGKLPH